MCSCIIRVIPSLNVNLHKATVDKFLSKGSKVMWLAVLHGRQTRWSASCNAQRIYLINVDWRNTSISNILTVARSVWPKDRGVVQQPVFNTTCICQAEVSLPEAVESRRTTDYTEMTM